MDGAEFWQQKAADSRRLAEQAKDDLIRDWHLAAERIWLRAAEESSRAKQDPVPEPRMKAA
jgi:hypothetical protein